MLLNIVMAWLRMFNWCSGGGAPIKVLDTKPITLAGRSLWTCSLKENSPPLCSVFWMISPTPPPVPVRTEISRRLLALSAYSGISSVNDSMNSDGTGASEVAIIT